jgi:Amt family ammonium transporter
MILLVKHKWEIDDSLDVFAVHGVGGITGSLLLSLFISNAWGGVGYAVGMDPVRQLLAQLVGVGVVALWSAAATVALGKAIARVLPMRVSEDDERDGLDLASHGERAWEIE